MQMCPWEAAQYLFVSSNVPPLFYYSHGLSLLFALVFGFILFFKARKAFSAKLLFVITLLFSAWVLLDLHIWATNNPSDVLFFWALIILVEVLIYVFSVYFIDVFNTKGDVSFNKKIIMSLLVLPIILALSTNLNLYGIDMSSCVALEGFMAKYYAYGVEIFSVLWILFYSIRFYRKSESSDAKKQVFFSTVGILFFLSALSSGNLIGSFTEQWDYSQFGLFVMPIFIGILAYLVVRYNSFSIKLIATQMLVWGLMVLIGSQFFFIRTPINRVLNGITFIATIFFGYLLVQSVKREVTQKEELAKLNINLETLLKQRESLVHLVTHKVKGSFTRSKYIFAGILDGMFGEVNEEIKKRAEQGLESDNMGIETVDLVLNAANLEKGTVKYEMKTVDLKEILESSISEKKIGAESKGLKVETEIKDGSYDVYGDPFWLREVFNNLVENSIKYTREGSIKISLSKKENGRILFVIKDTGVGITPEDKKNLFMEGGRGKDSVKINVDSTGYGLYSVKLIVEAHKGKVWAESEGLNQGSSFFVELPASS